MSDSNLTNYRYNGSVNGKGSHSWNCLGCSWSHSEIGGRKDKNRGQRKADNHKCYNSSNDPWSGRRDLQ